MMTDAEREELSFWNAQHFMIPDVRDGLTRLERTILFVLSELREEYGDRHIPMVLVYGRVVELLDAKPMKRKPKSDETLPLFEQ